MNYPVTLNWIDGLTYYQRIYEDFDAALWMAEILDLKEFWIEGF
jgi:hypothetical protein